MRYRALFRSNNDGKPFPFPNRASLHQQAMCPLLNVSLLRKCGVPGRSYSSPPSVEGNFYLRDCCAGPSSDSSSTTSTRQASAKRLREQPCKAALAVRHPNGWKRIVSGKSVTRSQLGHRVFAPTIPVLQASLLHEHFNEGNPRRTPSADLRRSEGQLE